MKIHSLNKYIIGGMIAGASLGLAGCNSSFNRLTNYMRKNNSTQEEYEKILYDVEQNKSTDKSAVMQCKLDSMAYRNLLNATALANDSATVAEFNALAGKSAANLKNSKTQSGTEKILKTIKDEGATIREYEGISDLSYDLTSCQFWADHLLYAKFFEKHGLMTNQFKKDFDEVSVYIRP